MCYQCLNQILLRVKTLATLGVNLCRALRLRVSVGASHHPSASHSSDIWRFIILSVFSALLLIGQICPTLPSDWSILPPHPCIWRNPSVHIFCRLNALNPVMIPGWEMTECGCHKISENDTKYPETWHDTCRGCHDHMTSGQDHEQCV